MFNNELSLIVGFGVVLILKVVMIAVPLGAGYLFLSKTRAGRRMAGRISGQSDDGLTLEVADQLRSLQSQVDEAHARLDFAERVLLEQREQLRVLGAPEPLAELREPTPV